MDSDHINEDVLERFSMGKLEEPRLSHFEEHYLICTHCQDRINQMDVYLHVVRKAASKPQPISLSRRLRSILTQPVLRPLLPATAIACLVFFAFLPYQSGGRQTVRLTSERGAPAGSALHSSKLTLALDVRGLEGKAEFFTEVADIDGNALWSGTALSSGMQATAHVSRRLSGGHYWVRIYSDPSRQDLLREYGLKVQ